jgi:hypothetical protein
VLTFLIQQYGDAVYTQYYRIRREEFKLNSRPTVALIFPDSRACLLGLGLVQYHISSSQLVVVALQMAQVLRVALGVVQHPTW